mgnify:CR=1 FL=1
MDFTESDLVCPDCGNYNKKSAKFCHTCGTKIEISEPVDEKESYAKILENERIKAEAELERSGRYSGVHAGSDWSPIAKMRWSIAIGGALLLALGLLMIVAGGNAGLIEMCWAWNMSGRCYPDFFSATIAWAIFWTGLIPTIFGIRYIAKA